MQITDAIPVYIISLPSSPRRKGISAALNSRRIQYRFLDAIDARIFNECQLDKFYDDKRARIRYGRALSRGEVGCFLSHRMLWERISLSGRSAIVLEDDALIDERFFSTVITASEAALSETADVILLGRSKLSRRREQLIYLYNPLKYKREVDGLCIGVPFKQDTCGTVGYWISANGAAKLFQQRKGNRVSVLADDWPWFRDCAGIRIAELRPYVIREAYESIPSTIESERAALSGHRSHFHDRLLEPIRFVRACIRWLIVAVFSVTTLREKLFPYGER